MRPHRSRPFAALVSAVSVCLVVACGSAGTSATLGPAVASSPVAPTDPISVPASRPSAAASESPPEPTGPPTQATELDVDIHGDVRHVRLYLPDPMPDGSRPLLVFLHPFGGTPMSAVVETRLDRLSVSDGVIVAFPPADGRGWAAQVTPGLDDSDVDERFLRGLIDRLVETYPVDRNRVFVAGFSMGAVMAGRLACTDADRIAAAVVVSGTAWIGDCRPSRPVSILIVHGKVDSTFRHQAAVAMADAWRTRDRCEPPADPTDLGSNATLTASDHCADGTVVQFVSVSNGTHAWFGQPSASELTRSFIAEHGRR